MKKTVLTFVLACLLPLCMACTGGERQEQPAMTHENQGAAAQTAEPTAVPEKIVIDNHESKLFAGEEMQLEATGAEEILWISSDPAVATVSDDGKVKGVSSGVVTVIASSVKDSEIKDEAQITVGLHVDAISLEEEKLQLLAGTAQADAELKVKIEPKDALIQGVQFSTSDENVVSVDETGILHAKAPGMASITVISQDTSCQQAATCQVTVRQGVSTISLSKAEAELYLNESIALQAQIGPEDAEDKTVAWSSSDEAVATVSQTGTVKAVAPGHVTIRCMAQDGGQTSAQCEVDIFAGVQKVTLDAKNETLLLGGSQELGQKTLHCQILPENASFKTIEWESSDESVAKVDANGIVVGVGSGKATITARTTDPRGKERIKDVCNVTVGKAVSNIRISDVGDRLAKGSSTRAKVTITPQDAYNPKLTWSSSNENVVKVDASGNFRAVGVGSATVTAKASDGSGVTESKKITVIQAVTGLSPQERGTSIVFAGDSKRLHVNVSPSDATDKGVTWKSDNTYVASVDAKGEVTGKNAGTATITAIAADGSGKQCTFSVLVEPKNPISLESLGFGIYNANLLGITVKNKCARTSIINFDFTISLYAYDGTKLSSSGSYSLGDDFTIPANSQRTIKRTLSGVSWAQKITMTITGVKLSDGTYYRIPSAEQETWSFSRR